MKWIGVLFIFGILADEMIIFSSLNGEPEILTEKTMAPKLSRKAISRPAGRRILPRTFRVLQRNGCGKFEDFFQSFFSFY